MSTSALLKWRVSEARWKFYRKKNEKDEQLLKRGIKFIDIRLGGDEKNTSSRFCFVLKLAKEIYFQQAEYVLPIDLNRRKHETRL